MKILVIEDSQTLALVIGKRLLQEGWNVIYAFDGIQATMMARNEQPDIVLLDINLPGGSGYVLYDRLKMLIHKPCKIFIMTALEKEKIQDFLKKNDIPEEDVFKKPLNTELVIERIKSYG